MTTVSECLEHNAYIRLYTVQQPDVASIQKIIVMFPGTELKSISLDEGDKILHNYNISHDYHDGIIKEVSDHMMHQGHESAIKIFVTGLIMDGMEFYKRNPYMKKQEGGIDFDIEITSANMSYVLDILQDMYPEDKIMSYLEAIFGAGILFMSATPSHFIFGIVQN